MHDIHSFNKGDFMKLSVKRLLLLSYFFYVPVLIGMIHEVEPVDAMGHVDNSRY